MASRAAPQAVSKLIMGAIIMNTEGSEPTSTGPQKPSYSPHIGTAESPEETEATQPGRSGLSVLAQMPRWARIVLPACVVVGLMAAIFVGFAAQPAVSSTKEYVAMADQLNAKISGDEATIAKLRSDAADKDAQIRTLQSASDGVKTLQQQLSDKEKTLAAKDADLAAREQKLAAAQKQVADSQIRNGLHVVGGDVQPGTYTTTGPTAGVSGCYYAWKTGTGSDAQIKDNNIVQGSATVTLNNGEVFESSHCAAWTKIG